MYNKLPHSTDLVQKAISAGDDEVLMVIGQKLPDLAEVLGSDGEGASSLTVSVTFVWQSFRCLYSSNGYTFSRLQPIISDVLVFVEEIVVAQAAADAFCAILPRFSADQVDKKALPLIRKLHEGNPPCLMHLPVSFLA